MVSYAKLTTISLHFSFLQRSPCMTLLSQFEGFRKLRTDPILTSDVDPRTACYVRFYHEKFQKDRPELLHQIKRATKSDQQSKDDVESLKVEVAKLKDCITHMSADMDRKLAEMSYEYNRRITNMSAEYDKLAALVQQIMTHQQHQQHHLQQQAPAVSAVPPQASHPPPPLPPPTSSAEVPAAAPAATTQAQQARAPDLMQSLSHVAAMSLQNQLRPPTSNTAAVAALNGANETSATAPEAYASSNGVTTGTKRGPPEEPNVQSSRTRTS